MSTYDGLCKEFTNGFIKREALEKTGQYNAREEYQYSS